MRLDWSSFSAIHGKDANDEFEVLSGMLVENIEKGTITNTPANYKGIESEPFKNKRGKLVAYQSKYFSSADEATKRSEFLTSLKKLTKAEVNRFNVLYIASNQLTANSQSQIKTGLTDHFNTIGATKPTIKFVCGPNIYKTKLLNDRSFSTSLAYFFGGGRPQDLQQANIEPKSKQIFTKNRYVELPMTDFSKKEYDSLGLLQKLLSSRKSNILITASAGTGKSRLLQKIAYDFSSLDKDNPEIMQSILKQGVVIFLRASLLKNQSLTELLSTRLKNFGLNYSDYPITLLLDGIDELNIQEGANIINELHSLLDSGLVTRCISSVRALSGSAIRYEQVMTPDLITIKSLDEPRIIEYFEKRGNKEKTKAIKEIIKQKKDIGDITDIRILELYWEVMDHGLPPDKPQILNAAFDENIKNHLDALNVLNPKDKSIKHLLQSISVEVLKTGGRTIELSKMQKKLLEELPRTNYEDVNKLIDLISTICGERSSHIDGEDFVFAHKSWVDYFAALYLANRFTFDKDVLLSLIDYEDLLSNWFIPVAKNEYKKKNLLPEAIAVGVVETYLGGDNDRTDDQGELVLKIRLSTDNEILRESILLEAERTISSNETFGPAIAYEYYLAGHSQLAQKLHELFKEKLSQKKIGEGIAQTYWDQLEPYFLLNIIFSIKPLDELHGRINEMIADYSNRADWNIPKKVREAIPAWYKELGKKGISTNDLLHQIEPGFFKATLGYIYQPETLRHIRHNKEAQSRILELIQQSELEAIDRLPLLSLVNQELPEEELQEVYKELNNKPDVHFDDPYEFHVRLCLLKNQLSWGRMIERDVDPPRYLTLQDIFDYLFNYSVNNDFGSDYSLLEKRIDEGLAEVSFYSQNRDAFSRRAITELLKFIAEKLSVTNFRSLISLSEKRDKKFYSHSLLVEEVFEQDKSTFKRIFKVDEVEDLLSSAKGDLESYTDELRSKAAILAYLEPAKSADLFNEIRRLTRLRYGYHKDMLGFFLPTALKIVWERNYYSHSQKLELTRKIYDAIMRIKAITDGDEVGWLPDQFFEILIENDFDLAAKYHAEYVKENYDMPILDLFNIARIRRGDGYDEVLRLANTYRLEYRTREEIFETYYESRFMVYVFIAANKYYSLQQRKEAIKLASEELKKLKGQDKDYRESDYRNSKDAKEAAKLYRQLKGTLSPDEKLETFPRPKKYVNEMSKELNQTLNKGSASSEYERKRKKANDYLQKIDTASVYRKIIKDIANDRFSDYDSQIVKSKQNVDLFIDAVEKNSEPFASIKHLVANCMLDYIYRAESQHLIYRLWNSPFYKNQFIEYLFYTSHHYDTNQLLKTLDESNERQLTMSLIDNIVDVITLLSRHEA